MYKFLNISFIFLFSLVFTNNVVLEIGGKQYNESFFYSLFPKKDWVALSIKQQQNILSEYINNKIIVLEAESDGYIKNPHFNVLLSSRINQFLVNVSYDFFVVLPLVDDSVFALTQINLKKEINVDHLLVGYNGCRLPSSFSRSKQEAYDLSLSFYNNLSMGASFKNLVSSFSDDPSADKNGGNLGWITWGKTVPVFQNAAFLLSPNEFSVPILTDYGYHIVLCKETRPSSFSFLDSITYNSKCLEASLASVPLNLKKEAAKEYDKNILKNSSVIYNYKTLHFLLEFYNKSLIKNKIISSGKRNFIKILNDIERAGVVCVYNGKGFGVQWFLNHLVSFPSSRVPEITSVEDLKNLFNTIILQKHALKKILLNTDNSYSFAINSETKKIKENLISDSYLKNYINNLKAPSPDSISSYYNKNLISLYTEYDLVSVREIKVLDSLLADSLYSLLQNGSVFSDVASSFSLTNPKNGGLIKPFVRGKYGPLGKVAFLLSVNSFSEPFSNLDNTWSILYLEEKIDSLPIPLDRVYSKIETVVSKKEQKKSRVSFLNKLKNKYSVYINKNFFNFEL